MITVADALFLAVLRMPVAVHWSSLDRLMTCFCALFLISAMQTQQLTQLYLSTDVAKDLDMDMEFRM